MMKKKKGKLFELKYGCDKIVCKFVICIYYRVKKMLSFWAVKGTGATFLDGFQQFVLQEIDSGILVSFGFSNCRTSLIPLL
jgi:hypothetical protein